MYYGFLFIGIGLFLFFYLIKIKLNKQIISTIGIILAILLIIYGLIEINQPSDYIKFTETTIVDNNKTIN